MDLESKVAVVSATICWVGFGKNMKKKICDKLYKTLLCKSLMFCIRTSRINTN